MFGGAVDAVRGDDGMIAFTIGGLVGVSFGILAGWKMCARHDHKDFNKRFRKSVRIAARSYKRRQNNGRPRKVHTAGDDYA